jgi:hypothetical protein
METLKQVINSHLPGAVTSKTSPFELDQLVFSVRDLIEEEEERLLLARSFVEINPGPEALHLLAEETKDEKESFNIYRALVVDSIDYHAHYMLGVAYAEGRGVKVDKIKAAIHLQVAVSGGHDLAIQYIIPA